MLHSLNKIYDYNHYNHYLHVLACALCHPRGRSGVLPIYCGCLNSFKHYLTTHFILNENVIKFYLSKNIIISERSQLSANNHLMQKLLLCELLLWVKHHIYANKPASYASQIKNSLYSIHRLKPFRQRDALKCDSILSVSG